MEVQAALLALVAVGCIRDTVRLDEVSDGAESGIPDGETGRIAIVGALVLVGCIL